MSLSDFYSPRKKIKEVTKRMESETLTAPSLLSKTVRLIEEVHCS